jgi:starch-binding outer membrane protein, SusD/RagB family
MNHFLSLSPIYFLSRFIFEFNMKYNFLIILILSLLSCNILDQKSPNDIAAEDVFTTAAGAENALVGLYSSLQIRDYYGGHYQLFPDALSGLTTTGGYDVASLDEFGAQAITDQNLYLESVYIAIYRTIANANRIIASIEKIPDTEFSDNRKERISAEARFVRAMAHFDLLRWFGYHHDLNSEFGIVIIDHVTTIEEIIARSKVKDCYKFVTDELTTVIDAFPADEVRNPNYINRSTIDALLARVFLSSGDYVKAASHAEAVLSRDEYTLLRGAEVNTFYSNRGTSESVFELAFDIRNISAFNGLTYLKDEALRPELSFLAAEKLNTFFSNRPNDVRAGLLDFINNDESILPDGRTQKYRGETTRDNPAYLLRTAELQLIKAESERKTGISNGLENLNALRTARGLGELLANDIDTDLKFATSLLDEVKAEFNFEGQYLYYLVRMGFFVQETGLGLEKGVFPIPNRELAATGGVVVQNPGY